MQKSGAAYSWWRKINLRGRKDSDMEEVTSRADELVSNLEAAESNIRTLIKNNVELTKTFAAELKNLAADFERRAIDERSEMDRRFGAFQKAIDKKLYSIQREMDESSGKLIDMAGQQGDLLKQEQIIVGEKLDRACGAVANVDGSITGIRNHLAEQNQIKRRYQEGYDFQILKNFVRQIIQIIVSLERQIGMAKDAETKRNLEDVHEDLIDLLDKNGVEQVTPSVGEVYNDALCKHADVIGTADAPIPSLAGSVAEVVQPGYIYTFINDEDRSRCLQPAKLILFQVGLDEEKQQAMPALPKLPKLPEFPKLADEKVDEDSDEWEVVEEEAFS